VIVFREAAFGRPVNASNATILRQQDGLPSVSITGMTAEGERLWIAYGQEGQEAGLGLYDPETHEWQTVLCSTMAGEPPFFSNRPYYLMRLTYTAPGRLLFVMSRSPSPEMWRWVGLWTMDTQTRKPEYLGECGTSDSLFGYMEMADSICWCKSGSSLVRLDLKSGDAFYVLGPYPGSVSQRIAMPMPWLKCRDDLFLPQSSIRKISFGVYSLGGLDPSTCAIHGSQLWARLGESQIAILKQGRPFEEARIIPNNILDGEPAVRFMDTPYGLVGIGNGTVGLVETDGGTQ
jgi:hypothetical protein